MKEENSESLQLQAYDAIRGGIVYARYAPGDKLQVKDLCADLDMGRTPIRESLVRLRQEGLVKTIPQSGTYVSKISLTSVESARYVRETLESQISVECCALLDDAGKTHFQELLAAGRQAEASQDRRAFFDTDNELHHAFYEIAGKERIWEWLAQISVDLQRYRWLRVETEELDWASILDQHEAICCALFRHRTDEVHFLVTNHLHLLFSESAAVMSRFPEYFCEE